MKFSKSLKILLFIGLVLLLCGGIVFTAAFAASGWDPAFLSGVVYRSCNFTETTGEINEISVDFRNAQIDVYVESDIQALSVEYPQAQNRKGENVNTVTVDDADGKLSVVESDSWNVFNFLWNFTTPTVTLRLPADRTYALSFATNNGNIVLNGENYTLTALTATTSNGNISSTADICATTDIVVKTNNGNIALGNISANSLVAQTNNGNVTVQNGNMIGSAKLTSDCGNVTVRGAFSASEFYAETKVGNVETISGCVTADKITLSTDVGNVNANGLGSA